MLQQRGDEAELYDAMGDQVDRGETLAAGRKCCAELLEMLRNRVVRVVRDPIPGYHHRDVRDPGGVQDPQGDPAQSLKRAVEPFQQDGDAKQRLSEPSAVQFAGST